MNSFDNPPVVNAAEEAAFNLASSGAPGSPFSLQEIQLTIIIFIFGLIATGVFYFLVKTKQATPYLMRIYVVIILIFGSLLVVSSGYAINQTAPIIGLFGTITGYLLGRSENSDRRPIDEQKE